MKIIVYLRTETNRQACCLVMVNPSDMSTMQAQASRLAETVTGYLTEFLMFA